MKPMMACGHAANAVDDKGNPCCAICIGIKEGATVVVETPDLTGREAKCSMCKRVVASSVKLPFFEYITLESGMAACLHCGYPRISHEMKKRDPKSVWGCVCSDFEPNPVQQDRYYCGCRGWD